MNDDKKAKNGPKRSRRRSAVVPTKDASETNESGDISKIPPEILEAAKSGDLEVVTRLIRIVHAWQAPLPPPEIFREYPDAVQNVITDNWVGESKHRRKIESRGQGLAAVIAIGAIVAAVFCSMYGQPLVGASIVIGAMVGIGLTGALRLFRSRE